MFTATFYVNKERQALYLRVIKDRKKSEFSMNEDVTEEELRDIRSCNTAPANSRFKFRYMGWLAAIEAVRCRIDDGELEGGTPRDIADAIAEAILGVRPRRNEKKPADLFLPFFEKHAASYTKRNTKESCLYTLSVIRRFCPKSDQMKFADVNYGFLSDLEKGMAQAGLSVNTRRIHMANIRAVINEAFRRELTEADPFRRFRIKREKTKSLFKNKC